MVFPDISQSKLTKNYDIVNCVQGESHKCWLMCIKIKGWHLFGHFCTTMRARETLFPYCSWWWNMNFLCQRWIKTTTNAVVSFKFRENKKMQANLISKKDHGKCFLGPKKCPFGWFYKPGNSNYNECILSFWTSDVGVHVWNYFCSHLILLPTLFWSFRDSEGNFLITLFIS